MKCSNTPQTRLEGNGSDSLESVPRGFFPLTTFDRGTNPKYEGEQVSMEYALRVPGLESSLRLPAEH